MTFGQICGLPTQLRGISVQNLLFTLIFGGIGKTTRISPEFPVYDYADAFYPFGLIATAIMSDISALTVRLIFGSSNLELIQFKVIVLLGATRERASTHAAGMKYPKFMAIGRSA